MKKILLVTILFIPHLVFSQNFSIYGSAGLNFGANSQEMDFGGETIRYGYGSGLGLHAGFQYDTKLADIFVYSEVGINWCLAYQYQNINGSSNKSAFTFNHKSVSLGVGKLFRIETVDIINGIRINAGLDYNFPSEGSLTENDFKYGVIQYDNSLGFHIESRLSLQLTDAFLLEPGFGFNVVQFNYTDFDWYNGSPEPSKLFPNASSLSFFLTARKLLKSKEE